MEYLIQTCGNLFLSKPYMLAHSAKAGLTLTELLLTSYDFALGLFSGNSSHTNKQMLNILELKLGLLYDNN